MKLINKLIIKTYRIICPLPIPANIMWKRITLRSTKILLTTALVRRIPMLSLGKFSAL
jgi:hypothetical protein